MLPTSEPYRDGGSVQRTPGAPMSDGMEPMRDGVELQKPPIGPGPRGRVARRRMRAGTVAVAVLLVGLATLVGGAPGASAFTISGVVTSQSTGTGVAEVEVAVAEAATGTRVATTSTELNGSYSVTVPAGKYNITFTPPMGSGYGNFVDNSEVVSANTTVNVTLIPAGSVQFAGVLRDDAGEAVTYGEISLRSSNGTVVGESRLSSGGAFAMTVAPGTYSWQLWAYREGLSHSAMPYYTEFDGSGLQLSASVNDELVLPFHALTVKTVGPSGSPIPGVGLSGSGNQGVASGVSLGDGLTVSSDYVSQSESTNSEGIASVALPNWRSGYKMTLAVSPPSGSELSKTTYEAEGLAENESTEIHLVEGVHFDGVLRDDAGEAVTYGEISLRSSNGTVVGESRLSSGGAFAMTVAPGTYSWQLWAYREGLSHSAMPYYTEFDGSGLQLSASVNDELVLPFHALTVKTVGPSGSPIPGVGLSGSGNQGVASGVSLGDGLTVSSDYVSQSESTNSEGIASVALPDWRSGYKMTLAVSPPSGSELSKTTYEAEGLAENESTEIHLVEGVHFDGVLRDDAGEAVTYGEISLRSSNGTVVGESRLSSGGAFAMTVAPGTYSWQLWAYREGLSHSAMPYYTEFDGSGLQLSASVNDELVLPFHALTVKTVGPSGSPIPGVGLSGSGNQGVASGVSLGDGLTVSSDYVSQSESTNSEGIASVALPDWRSGYKMTLAVSPPSETDLPKTTLETEGLSENATRVVAFGKSGSDTTPPEIKCESPPTGWQANNVTIACTASDSGTGLAHSEDASFSLSTNVNSGEETATAYTGSHRVCDKADNCSEAGPLGPIMIDRRAPTITIKSPSENETVEPGSSLTAEYSCADGGSGVASCEGSVPSGSSLETSSPGRHTLVVNGTDDVGNRSSSSVSYLVAEPKGPTVECGSPNGSWHGQNVSIPCTASEPGGALAHPEEASFSLSTSVGEGEETAGAYTSSREVCDTSGRCTLAGPVGPLKIDRKAPSIDVSEPEEGAVVVQGSTLKASYSCSDGGSGVASCEGSVPSGGALETSAAGEYELSVAATDGVGNAATRTIHYTVVSAQECGGSSQLCQEGLADTTPPKVAGLTVSPATVNTSSGSQTVTVDVHATDDLSGVAGVVVSLSNGSRYLSSTAHLLAGGERLDGTWEASVTLPQFAAAGRYSLSVGVVDNVGNHHTYSSAELEELGFPASVREEGEGDTTPPTILGVSANPDSVSTCGSSATTQVLVHESDASGVSGVTVYLSGPGGQQLSAAASLSEGASAKNGTWAAGITLPAYAQQGEWKIAILSSDSAGNSAYTSAAQLAGAGYTSAVQQSCAGDTTPPAITSVALNPESVDTSTGSREVTVTVQATDDLSGVAAIEATLGSGGQSHSAAASLTSGSNRDGTWTATIDLPRWSRQGTWALSLTAVDKVGNSVALSSTQLANDGQASSVAQIGEEDDTPPGVSGGSVTPNSINTSKHPVKVKIHVDAGDTQSGVGYVIARFTSPNGEKTISGTGTLTSGSSQEGEWTIALEFPQYSEKGGWHLSLELWDAFGNHRAYSPHELSEKGLFTAFKVGAPEATTTPASEATQTTATLNGSVDPNGSEITGCRFEYGKEASYGLSVPCSTTPEGDGEVVVAAPVAGLSPSTTYHFRIVVLSPDGEGQGEDLTFKTGPPGHWYEDGKPFAEQGAAAATLKGKLTLHTSRASIACRIKGAMSVENPAGGGAGTGRITQLTLRGCKATPAQCPKGAKLAATSEGLPWAMELAGRAPVRDKLSGIRVALECTNKGGAPEVVEQLTGSLAPQVLSGKLDFDTAAGELAESTGGRAGLLGEVTTKGPKKERTISAEAP